MSGRVVEAGTGASSRGAPPLPLRRHETGRRLKNQKSQSNKKNQKNQKKTEELEESGNQKNHMNQKKKNQKNHRDQTQQGDLLEKNMLRKIRTKRGRSIT